MPVVEAITEKMPSTFSKGSGQYAGIKQEISDCDFDLGCVKVTCEDTTDQRKTMIAIRTYLSKIGLNKKGIVARKNNLEIWVGLPS